MKYLFKTFQVLKHPIQFVVLFLLLLGCGKESGDVTLNGKVKLKTEVVRQSIIEEGYFKPTLIGNEVVDKPWITDLKIVDLDQDGFLDVVACEGKTNEIIWIRQYPLGIYTEKTIGGPVDGPAHISPCDIDQDGDIDLLIASMGVIFPNDDKIGAVVLLEQTEAGVFSNRVLLDKVARVTDVRAGDIDDDGDLDLSVAQFGYNTGEGRWMENKGNWEFESHILTSLSGAIHCPIADLNGDNKLDILMLISQEWEELHLFQNEGTRFDEKIIFGSINEDYGSSGIRLVDLDRDTDLDVLYTNGDAFDYSRPGPRPWHGVQWLENVGQGFFKFHRLGDFAGAYSPIACDVDNDGDLDVLAVSGFNHWESGNAISLICFENDGRNHFKARPLARTPTHLIVMDAADMDNDGQVELVTGSFHAYPPYDNLSRITLWDVE